MSASTAPAPAGEDTRAARPSGRPADLAALAGTPDDATVGVGAVAVVLSCSERHLWRRVDAGRAPAPLRIGRLRRWRIGTLRDWIRGGCQPVRQAGRA